VVRVQAKAILGTLRSSARWISMRSIAFCISIRATIAEALCGAAKTAAGTHPLWRDGRLVSTATGSCPTAPAWSPTARRVMTDPPITPEEGVCRRQFSQLRKRAQRMWHVLEMQEAIDRIESTLRSNRRVSRIAFASDANHNVPSSSRRRAASYPRDHARAGVVGSAVPEGKGEQPRRCWTHSTPWSSYRCTMTSCHS